MRDRGQKPDAVLIAGPTASGKSSLALRLAARIGGLIIDADSMQVYRDLRILTARPSVDDERQAPHALYGHVDAAETYSVSRWLDEASHALKLARQEDLTPIFVGGTGLYFKALTQGLSDIPPVPPEVRAEVRAWAATVPVETLHAELSQRDARMAARLRPTDPQRIIRALEVHKATGASLADFQGTRTPPLVDVTKCMALYLETDRATLRARIDRRFDAMMASGALDEVRQLSTRNLDPKLPAMRALGVPHLMRHLQGETGIETAVAEAKTATRRYIKRQDTFARHQLPAFEPIDLTGAEARLGLQSV